MRRLVQIFIFILSLVFLMLLSTHNYLLFHTVIELASVVLSISMLLISLVKQYREKVDPFDILAVIFGGIAFIDIFHLVTFKGMGIFSSITTNEPTQFWIIGRALQAVLLLYFALILRRKNTTGEYKIHLIFISTVSIGVTIGAYMSVMVYKIFPVCHIPGTGLTGFKIAMEYIIIAVLGFVVVLLYMDKYLSSFKNIRIALIVTILSEFMFTLYNDVYGFYNMTGHIAKVLAFFYIFREFYGYLIDKPNEIMRKMVQELSQKNAQIEMIGAGLPEAFLFQLLIRGGKRQYTYISKSVENILGLDREVFYSDVNIFYSRISPDDRERVLQEESLMTSGNITAFTTVYKIRNYQNKYIHVQCMYRADIREDGIIYLDGILYSIEEKMKMDNEIRTLSERYELAVRGTDEGIWDWNLLDDSLFVSDRWKSMLGICDVSGPFRSNFFFNLIHPDDIAYVKERVNDYFKSGEKLYSMEFRMLHRDGSYRWILARGEAVRDFNGRPLRMAGSHTDITEKKELEIALVMSHKLLQKISEQVPGLLFVLNADSNGQFSLPFVSKNLNLLFEIVSEKSTYLIHKLYSRVHREDRVALREQIACSYKTLSSFSFEFRLALPSKRVIWLELSAVPEKLVTGHVEWYGTIHDITALKKNESQLLNAKIIAENANRAKSEFISGISHDLRTPMNGIIGFTDMLDEMERDPEKKKYIELIKLSADNLLMILNTVLDLSIIEVGKYVIIKENIESKKMCSDIAVVFEELARRKELDFQFVFSDKTPDYFYTDRKILYQIISNILGNALKFTQNGMILFQVEPYEHEDSKAVQFIIRDTGPGINKKKMDALFEPYEQGDVADINASTGTGLGLYIVKKMTDFLNGTVIVHSDEGVGTEFRIIIPVSE